MDYGTFLKEINIILTFMMYASIRKIGALIIGDEILSGKRKINTEKIIAISQKRFDISYMYLPDTLSITTVLKSLSKGDVTFSSGEWSNPDDHTRQCAAGAIGVPLILHPDAKRDRGSFWERRLPQRILMGVFTRCFYYPKSLQPNTWFFHRDHHFLPGFPVMAWPML